MKLLCLLMFSCSLPLFSQYKIEREYRIKETDAPNNSTETIRNWNFPNKVKWYAEESQDGKTFEAKTKFQNRKYSIEFSEKGDILDVEVQVLISEIPKNLQVAIEDKLRNRFSKYDIRKIQIQYIGSNAVLKNRIFNDSSEKNNCTTNYELVIKGKKKQSFQLYEFLFDSKGTLLKELPFKETNSDNLEF